MRASGWINGISSAASPDRFMKLAVVEHELMHLSDTNELVLKLQNGADEEEDKALCIGMELEEAERLAKDILDMVKKCRAWETKEGAGQIGGKNTENNEKKEGNKKS